MEPLPDVVKVADYGIRGVHLAYELAGGGCDTLILVDATPRGGEPGTVYVIEAGGEMPASASATDAHGLTPHAILAWLDRFGARPPRVLVVECEPALLEESMELSQAVRAAVGEGVRVTRRLAVEAAARLQGPEVHPCA